MKSFSLKFIFIFIFYLIVLSFFEIDISNISIIISSVLFVSTILILYNYESNKFKSICMEFDKLYLFFFDKEKKHKDFSDIENSLGLITSDIFNKKNNIDNLEKYRSKFLGNVSHEIKTPLFILQGYIDTLINGAVNDPEVNIIFLNKIKNQSLRLNNLMEDLIKISMIESDELKLKTERISFKEIISFLDSDFSQILINRGDKLVFPDKIDHLFVDVDKKNILIVFRNIINNAISYSDTGNVIISAKVVKNKLNIKIIDHGIGIDESNIKRIFERFYRADNDRSRKKGGTGLGLAIVKHILLAHNININIESKLGVGSTFSFRLPISKT